MKVNLGKFSKKVEARSINVEIEDHDTWSLDHSLAYIILPALIQLKETMHGIPGEFADVGGEDMTNQQPFDFYKESYPEAFNEGCKRWDEVLDKMIWSFQQLALEEYDTQYHHGKAEYDWKQTDTQFPNPITGAMEPTYQMINRDPNSHWYDHVGHKLHEERIQEGLNLFAKYYRSIWD